MSSNGVLDVEYPLDPALDFLRRLWQLNQALERVSARMEKRIQVTAQQRLLLRCIGKYPGVSAGHLAGVLCLDPGTISASLNRLESRGLLDRRRDPKDKRRVALGLTSTGRAVDSPARGTVESAVDELLSQVPLNELATTVRVLETLTELLHEAAHHE